ncbi:MAG: bifunctional folylpolyglutamate synthase/dihydrofolate synthase [Paludibacteraceae bacterium]
MNYNETIQYLYDCLPVFHQIGAAAYKPGLETSIKIMDKIGNPQNAYKTIHVAGTNGKGSVSHFLSAILQSAGFKTGLYTSPHLMNFGERVRVNGEMVKQQFVIDFIEKNKILFDDMQPSFFEATMALAFDYFSVEKVDVAVIEVGLGGRLDSTNIIHPELSVITNISFDHMQFLGDTLDKIAFEKAGIIKPKTPVVVGETLPETKPVFLKKANSENVLISFAEETQQIHFLKYENDKMIVETPEFGELIIGLNGIYQLKNVATVLDVVAKLQKLGFNISEENIRDGLKNVVSLTGLQGRWQVVRKNPKTVLDTGHNKAGFEYITEQLKDQKYGKLHIVFGMVNDKDISGVLSLLPQDAEYYFTAAQTKRALAPEELKKLAEKFSLDGNIYKSVSDAVKSALTQAAPEDFIYIGGSNFVVGEALELF